MRTIEVSETLWRDLQSLAEPLVDTTETVIRRLLTAYHQPGRTSTVIHNPPPSPKRGRPKGVTSRRKMMSVLALVLASSRDGLTRSEALEGVEAYLGDRLTSSDRGLSDNDAVRWHANVGFSRKDLLELGVLDKAAPRGLWRLTDGWASKVADVRQVIIDPAPDAPENWYELGVEQMVDSLLFPHGSGQAK